MNIVSRAPSTSKLQGSSKKKINLSNVKRYSTPYWFLLPGMAVFVTTIIFPIFKAFQISFYEWKVLPGIESPFLGFGNYTRALHDPIFWKGLGNSGFYMLVTVPPQIILGLMAAMLLNKKIAGRTTFRVLFYLPVVTSWVVVSILFRYLFSGEGGLFNWILKDVLHLVQNDVQWFGSRWPAMLAISALGIWKGIGWSMIIFLAALQNVSPELEEAAAIDGANAWQRFRVVTLPSIRRTATFISIMLVIGGFNVFLSVFLMTDGGPSNETEVVLTYMYRQAFSFLDFGYGSALAFLLTGIILTLSILQWNFFRPKEDS
jgi:multiple sugar transport system permease protein